MKHFYLLGLFLTLFSTTSMSQDIGVTGITSPVTGCNLSSTEVVTIRIFNYGGMNMSGVPFTVSYTLNGGPGVVEAVSFPSFLPNSTVTYSFITTADLSVPGPYTIDATATVPGDINLTNNALTGYVVQNSAPSVGGVVTGGGAACITGNNGTLTLSGHTGNVLNWEFSQDGGNTWINISNNGTTQNYNNLFTTTWYRVKVQNGVCPVATSAIDSITLDQASVAGNLTGNATVCAGSNSGSILLGPHVGNVNYWEQSINGGSTWTPIANTGTIENYTNLPQTTVYRTMVQNGACPQDTSTTVTITTNPVTVGGTVAGSATVCSGSNSGLLNLSGHTGTVVRWEFSANGGSTWSNIANTSTSQTYLNLTGTRLYRALLKSGVCSNGYSDTATITVLAASNGGTVSSNATVCSGSNAGTLTLAGHTGTIDRWQFSINNGATWTNITNTTTSQSYANLTTTTRYRAVVQVGTCQAAFSNHGIITVDPVTVSGTLAGSSAVCQGNNSGAITLGGNTGGVVNWETSTDNGATWTTIANTTTTESYSNVSTPTLFRALVQSGTCAAVYSDTAALTVDVPTVAGTVTMDDTVCAGSNGGVLNLNGQTGNIIRWQSSINGGSTWSNISNTTASHAYNNLVTTTSFRAQVKSGSCPTQNATFATITVDPVSAGGTISGGDTVCAGSNAGVLNLAGHTGTITGWETSTDAGVTWTSTGNTTTSEAYTNLTQTTWYRAIVQSGVCSADTSQMDSVVVIQVTAGGNIMSSDTVCAGSNYDTLHLTGYTGTIQHWEISQDGGNTWLITTNNNNWQVYNNLGTTTQYRVLVQSGLCPTIYSDTARIVTTQPNMAGTISGTSQVCEVHHLDSLYAGSFTGTLTAWESSNDNLTWTSTGNTNAVQSYTGLTQNTWFRYITGGGVCPADTSNAFMVMVHPAPVAGFTANDTCLNHAVSFASTSSVSAGTIASQIWSLGDGNNSMNTSFNHMYQQAGIYTISLIVTSAKGCSDTATGTVEIFGLPDASITANGPLSFCPGGDVTLTAQSGLIYLWSNGDTLSSVTMNTSGQVQLLVTDTNGCRASDSVLVTVYPAAIATVSPDTMVSLGNSIALYADGGTMYSWTPAETLDNPLSSDPIASPVATTTYLVSVTDINNCTDTASVTVTVDADYSFTIANMVTPNGDGYNDTWKISNIELYPENTVVIFNRYGRVVYEASAYQNDWDGTYNGNPLPDGTYHYLLRFTNSDKVFKGSITILRGE